MKRGMLALAGLALLGGSAFADVTKDEIIKLKTAGLDDEVIVAHIKASGPVEKLSAEDIIELSKSGVGTDVLVAAIANQRKAAPARIASIDGTRGYRNYANYIGASPYHSYWRLNYSHDHHYYRHSVRPHGYRHFSNPPWCHR